MSGKQWRTLAMVLASMVVAVVILFTMVMVDKVAVGVAFFTFFISVIPASIMFIAQMSRYEYLYEDYQDKIA